MKSGKPFRLTAIAVAVLALTPVAALAVEIEQRSLSNEPPPVAAVLTLPAQAPIVAPRPVPAPSPTLAQVVRQAPPAVNPAWDMFQQLETLQTTVATMQGQLEEQQQLIERMREDMRVRYTDLDQRIELLANRGGVAAPAPAPVAAPADAPAPAGNGVVLDPAATAPVPVPVPTPIVEQPAAAAPATTVPARSEDISPAEIEAQKQAYLAAYQRFRSDGAATAITAMQGFIKQYPNSVFAPNAHYWVGEFELALEPANYQAAETSFNRVIKDYVGSPKVPSATYKMGTIADLRGQRDEARQWMNDVLTKYPDSPEARLAKAYLDQNPAGVAPAGGKR